MANLDKLLKQIEKNKETENETTTHPFTIKGETFNIRTMTRREKRDFIYKQETNTKNMTAGDIVKKMKPFVYRSVEEFSQLAVKAKEAGHISRNEDVVEALFEPEEIIEIIGFITEINGISANDVASEVEEIKKQ